MVSHELQFRGTNITIEGTYYTGSISTHYNEPPEPEEFEIEKVTIETDTVSVDVTELIEDAIYELETLILEKYYR